MTSDDFSTDSALPTFIAESRELLADMEATLLLCEQGTADAESINAIFRAAHTIKGSSGLFGLDAIVSFTHVVESVLDRVRSEKLQLSRELAAILLECCDHIQRLIGAIENGGDASDSPLRSAGSDLIQALNGASGMSSSTPAAAARSDASTSSEVQQWHISVQFLSDVLRNGMDPLSFIRYLTTLGDIAAIQVVETAFPETEQFDPESCYLGFEIDLSTRVDQQRIEAAFEFVREDCKLSVTSTRIDAEISAPALDQREARSTKEAKGGESRSLRVDGDKLDRLIDLIGELVTAGATTTIEARKAGSSSLNEATLRLARLVEDVRDQALQLRMVQIGPTFSRFQRIVRDVARQIGKEIRLEISGAETELDKTLIESITDPLTHLVRNAIDHGIETAELRASCGKPSEGLLRLNAYHDSGSVVIEVSDDGAGLKREKIIAKAIERGLISEGASLSDSEAYSLIFEPGFSTADQITNLSGRGVGMDVVKRNVAALRGTIELDSKPGNGTLVRIRMPLTLAIIDGFLVRVGSSFFVIPLEMVEECVEVTDKVRADDEHHFINLRGGVLPFIRLRQLFSVSGPASRRESIVVIRCAGKRIGIVIDELLGEMQTVIKPLSRLFSRVRGIGGSTILGTGQLALILDVPSLLEQQLTSYASEQTASARRSDAAVPIESL
jgi:two-component system, chemotaxis family, sensor kinase CheA